ncbi:ankyrin-1-like [Periplaneta americana]|uniref:ankyrin-1-like n=1 Tax=Periplaneta americana TaxID=6978 RepID=UPI0037E8B426
MDENITIYELERPRNLLQGASLRGSIYEVEVLLKYGFDVTRDGGALEFAVHSGNGDLVTLLIKYGSVPNPRKRGLLVNLAAKLGHVNCLEALYNAGYSMECTDGTEEDLGPIHMAALHGRIAALAWLLGIGVSIDMVSGRGYTPLSYAILQTETTVFDHLLRRGACVNAVNHLMYMTTPLHLAVKRGQLRIVRSLLESGASYGLYCTENYQTPVHWAAMLGRLDVLEEFGRRGANLSVETNDEDGNHPIHIAARSGKSWVVQWLVNVGVSVNSVNRKGHTPLHISAYHGEVDMLRVLVNLKANVHATDFSNRNALHLAVIRGHEEVVRLLLELSVSPNVVDAKFYTPMHNAAMRNREDILFLLVSSGGNVDLSLENERFEPLILTVARNNSLNTLLQVMDCCNSLRVRDRFGRNLLHYAVLYGSMSLAQRLVSLKGLANVQDSVGQTPLHVAVRHGYIPLVRLMMKNHASPYVRSYKKWNVMHFAAYTGQEYCMKEMLKIDRKLKDLLSQVTTDTGFTPLHLAAKYGNISVVEFLVRSEININAKGKHGNTALCEALIARHLHICMLLIEHKCDVNVTFGKTKETPFLEAARWGNLDLMSALAKAGADVNAVNKPGGYSALHFAALDGCMEKVIKLRELGADVTIRNSDGFIARDLAIAEKQFYILRFLDEQ